MPTRTRVKVSPEMGEGGSQEQSDCRQNKAQLINSLQVVNKKLANMMMITISDAYGLTILSMFKVDAVL